MINIRRDRISEVEILNFTGRETKANLSIGSNVGRLVLLASSHKDGGGARMTVTVAPHGDTVVDVNPDAQVVFDIG